MTDHSDAPGVNPWLTAVAVMFGTFMVVLDTTVVNVSLPQIAGSLGATVDEATWALTSYLVANAVVLPLTGWLATVFGRKRLLIIAVIGFTSASGNFETAGGDAVQAEVLDGANGSSGLPDQDHVNNANMSLLAAMPSLIPLNTLTTCSR